jgi:excisionase family DNA binding protein
MQLTPDDIDAAYYVNHRYLDPLRKAGKLGQALESWFRKVDLAWELSARGPEIQAGSEQSEVLYTVAEAAAEMDVTQRHVRRLAQRGDIDARRYGRDWLIPPQAVSDYLQERRRNGRSRSGG